MSESKESSWEIIFNQQPEDVVTEDCLKVVAEQSSNEVSLESGQVLLKLTHISVDPYMRSRMNKTSYADVWKIGHPGNGGVSGVVVKSNFEGLVAGDHVITYASWKSQVVVSGKTCSKVPAGLSPSLFLGGLGMPGLSAYFPFKKFSKLKSGDVVFVSGAAGAVGTIFGQLAKNAGCTVYGSAGTSEKIELIKSLGYDDGFDYRKVSPAQGLDELLKGRTIDCYFDNVGGETLDAVLPRMSIGGRIICCGMISQYNVKPEEVYGLKNVMNIVSKRLTLNGFIVSDWAAEFGEASKELVGLCLEKKIKPIETIVKGYKNVPKAFVGLFQGENTGKMVVQVSEE